MKLLLLTLLVVSVSACETDFDCKYTEEVHLLLVDGSVENKIKTTRHECCYEGECRKIKSQ